jgi:CBS domain-containing protein
MQARELMTTDPAWCTPESTVRDAAELMRLRDCGCIPVLERDSRRLVGVVTDRDIVVRGIADGSDPRSVQVGDIASRDIVTVRPDDDLDEALRLMGQHQVRRLPVVDEGQLVGVLAQADVAHEAKDKDVGQVVEEISKP